MAVGGLEEAWFGCLCRIPITPAAMANATTTSGVKTLLCGTRNGLQVVTGAEGAATPLVSQLTARGFRVTSLNSGFSVNGTNVLKDG